MQNEKQIKSQIEGVPPKKRQKGYGSLLSFAIGLGLCLVTYLFASYKSANDSWHSNKELPDRPNKNVTTNTAKKQELVKPRFETSESITAIPPNNKIAVGDSYTAAN